MTLQEEITRRRTFAIISHPDAGKTTLTEKLLLFGGAIHVAGAVKSNKIKKGATSDFMEIERQRGISVATSVMGFEYKGVKINILDTPGHEDFAEDTYRTLTAVDSVIIVIDGAKGVEQQTRRLMEVCRMRKTPVMVFINKLDRPCKDPFDLLDEVERELRIRVRPLAFPISNGTTFKGVYNIYAHDLSLFTSDERQTATASTVEISDLASAELDAQVGERYARQLRDDLELIEGVYDPFDRDEYLAGDLARVFFGSAINNFGVTFAKGEYLLFLNNDTELIAENFIEEMLGLCQREDVGAVGARLLYQDDTIQHAGVVIGFGGIAGHTFIGLHKAENSYFHRAMSTQDYSAVTAACLMTKKALFDEVGGFTEKLAVTFNDIDYCMKVRASNHNPYALLYHYESKSRGLEDTPEKVARFNREIKIFSERWPEILKNGDPYYNPNLTLRKSNFALRDLKKEKIGEPSHLEV